jgi:hypothetical protein
MSGSKNARQAVAISNRGITSGGSWSGAKAGNPSLMGRSPVNSSYISKRSICCRGFFPLITNKTYIPNIGSIIGYH